MESCETFKYQNKAEHEDPCKNCTHNATDNYEPLTNADRIRNMTDEELEEWLTTITNDAQRAIAESQCFVDYQWKEWLQSEVE